MGSNGEMLASPNKYHLRCSDLIQGAENLPERAWWGLNSFLFRALKGGDASVLGQGLFVKQ